ncbi:MAG: hypothetical protein U0166_09395 [Acidobacteriota bacterium]
MSTATLPRPIAAPRLADPERGHRRRLAASYSVAIASLLGLAAFGARYYMLPFAERPFSERHALLRPTGTLGLRLGFAALAMLLGIFLYPLRKRWSWLSRRGSSRRWLDYHVLLGLFTPVVVAFHASFKSRGFAGMAFWIMVAVALSGVIGRYLYAQIPRRLARAELSLKEIQETLARASAALADERLVPEEHLGLLLCLPSPARVEEMSTLAALGTMVAVDVRQAVGVARLRRRAVPFPERVRALGGFLSTSRADLEHAIATARREASTAKKVIFLGRAQQVFRLWHVVHRPFSYTLAILVAIHVGVVITMGYF